MGIDERQGLSAIKLKDKILSGKRGSKSTPSPSWKLGFDSSLSDPNSAMNNSISARKIGANLWEGQTQFTFTKDGGDRLSRHRRHHSHETKGVQLHQELGEESPDNKPSQPPETEAGLRRNLREVPSQRHSAVESKGQSLQHVSSASYCSSMEVTPFVRAGSVEFKGRFGESNYGLKTSAHLLKVLNRIWKLEEQHSSNKALVKALKRELENSQAQIKTLLQERKRDHQEIEGFKKSMRDEIEVERKLRKHSEGLHHKLSRELLEARSSFSGLVKELKREKKARMLLESLCDEFAKGIRDYQQKVRILQQNPVKEGQIRVENDADRLILHVSEAWLDERRQMKKSISDDLSFEIESFLEAKQKQSLEKIDENKSFYLDNEKPSRNPEIGLNSVTKKDVSVRELMSKTTIVNPGATEPSSRQIENEKGVKENTLMAKLLEARLEGQLSRRSRTIKK